MRILIDIGHPAHVHLFKHFAWDMQSRGHNVFFTCRDKEFEIYLLEKYGFQYKSFGKKYTSTIGKLWGMVEFGLKELFVCLKFKPHILLSHGSMYAAHAAFLLGKPHISLEDTFNFEQIRFYKPFTKHILTADYEHPLIGSEVINYAGYHELSYLHPNRFTPDKLVLNELGVNEGERYVIIRFVSWNASHDIGHKGISYENKLRAIEEFSKYARVFISSESKLPTELEQYRIIIAPHRMHDAMAFASLVWGESFTMPAEASVLGIPSIEELANDPLIVSDAVAGLEAIELKLIMSLKSTAGLWRIMRTYMKGYGDQFRERFNAYKDSMNTNLESLIDLEIVQEKFGNTIIAAIPNARVYDDFTKATADITKVIPKTIPFVKNPAEYPRNIKTFNFNSSVNKFAVRMGIFVNAGRNKQRNKRFFKSDASFEFNYMENVSMRMAGYPADIKMLTKIYQNAVDSTSTLMNHLISVADTYAKDAKIVGMRLSKLPDNPNSNIIATLQIKLLNDYLRVYLRILSRMDSIVGRFNSLPVGIRKVSKKIKRDK